LYVVPPGATTKIAAAPAILGRQFRRDRQRLNPVIRDEPSADAIDG
jgi:hypothetical protein